jgi:hypothetical protein
MVKAPGTRVSDRSYRSGCSPLRCLEESTAGTSLSAAGTSGGPGDRPARLHGISARGYGRSLGWIVPGGIWIAPNRSVVSSWTARRRKNSPFAGTFRD